MHFLFSLITRKTIASVHTSFYKDFSLKSLLNHDAVKQYLKSLNANRTLLIREHPQLGELLDRRNKCEKELNELSLVTDNDKDLTKLIEEEKLQFAMTLAKANEEILRSLLPSDENRDVTIEVMAGVGGKEAMHFAGELFEMYTRFCIYKGWQCEVQERDSPETGGIRHASAFVSGRQASVYFAQESGVHRVQRVPATEKSGRVHTSTVTVAVLPQPTDFEVVIDDKDLKIETKRSSGAGGQHVNKTESCVRITHLPSGISIENQTDRSQIRNRRIAMQRLRAKLYQMELEGLHRKTVSSRKEQVGSSARSEKIRTYNYNQDRVTDHRIGANMHNLHGFLEGGKDLDHLIAQLIERSREQELLSIVEEKLKAAGLKN